MTQIVIYLWHRDPLLVLLLVLVVLLWVYVQLVLLRIRLITQTITSMGKTVRGQESNQDPGCGCLSLLSLFLLGLLLVAVLYLGP